MTDSVIIAGGLQVYSILVSLILVYGLLIQQKQNTTRLFLIIIALNIAGLVSDMLYPVFEGTAGVGVRIAVHVNNALNHIFALLIIACLAEFLWLYLDMKGVLKKGDRRYFKLMWGICAATVAVTIVAECTGLYSYFDANQVYHATEQYWLSMVVPLFLLGFCTWFVFRYRQRFTRWESLSFLMVFTVLPLVTMVQQVINPDITLAYVYVNIIIMLLYSNLYIEQRRALQRKETDLAQTQIAAMLADMRPDFLYDSLATLETLCITQPESAKDMVLSFTKNLRVRLDSMKTKMLIPFEEEIAHVKNTARLLQAKYGDTLEIHYDIRAAGFVLPALTVQSILETFLHTPPLSPNARRTLTIASYENNDAYVVDILFAGEGAQSDTDTDAMDKSRFDILRQGLSTLCGGSLQIERHGPARQRVCVQIPKCDDASFRKGGDRA